MRARGSTALLAAALLGSLLRADCKKGGGGGKSAGVGRLRGESAAATSADPRELPQCFTRPVDFRSPIRGVWSTVNVPVAPPAAAYACPFRRAWERCTSDRSDVWSAAFAPHDCTLSPIRAGPFLERMRGRRLIFVGDSVHVQMAVAVACALHAQIPSINATLKYDAWKPLKKRCGDTPLERCHWENGCIDFPRGVSVCMRFVSVVGNRRVLDAALVGLQATDVVVYGSVGLHFKEGGFSADAVELVQEASMAPGLGALEASILLQAMFKLPGRVRPFLVWREVTAQHFGAAGGHYTGSADYNQLNMSHVCIQHPPAEMEAGNRWNPAGNAIMEAHGVPILRVWDATQQAHFAHVGYGDCTHYCNAPGPVPEHWTLLLTNLLERFWPEEATAQLVTREEGQACFLPAKCRHVNSVAGRLDVRTSGAGGVKS